MSIIFNLWCIYCCVCDLVVDIVVVINIGPCSSFGSVHKAVHNDSKFTLAVKIVEVSPEQTCTDIQREIEILKVSMSLLFLYCSMDTLLFPEVQ
jgi:hypothetical protein